MKTVLMMLAALAVSAILSAPGLAQADSIQSRPTTQPRSPGGEMPSDTNEPDRPGGDGGTSEPSPGGGGGDGPADGGFDPSEVNFPTRQSGQSGDGMDIPPLGPSGPLIPEIPDEPDPDPEPVPQPQPNPTSADLVCCRAFYTGAEWSTREACINGGGDVARDNLCTPEDGANDGSAVPLRVYEGYELVPLDNGEADTRSGETVDGEPVRRRQVDN